MRYGLRLRFAVFYISFRCYEFSLVPSNFLELEKEMCTTRSTEPAARSHRPSVFDMTSPLISGDDCVLCFRGA
ncbi:hypothetical protein I7I53_11251 [Histoplasma capsulatum var. duboisii H88]|uniref:Uncharacterized protein n=1 Tax=Ajellomyces capsulatus (strain H88) TaxID=544711 RepID=A0A8A1L992_AJEC8|nr:hypothetical protein I7I53_11251 [Histoplasma capsulatum var. duboisii H88]